MHRRFDSRVERAGVTSVKWRIIAAVASHPGATQRHIAELLNQAEAFIGRQIDQLCADGYLSRQPAPHDRRAYQIRLTKAADPLLVTLNEIGRRNEEEAFAGLSEAELALFKRIIDKIEHNLATAGPVGELPEIAPAEETVAAET